MSESEQPPSDLPTTEQTSDATPVVDGGAPADPPAAPPPQPALRATADNPVPIHAICGEITAADGVRLRFARFPSTRRRRGTVCLFQGRAEYIEKYFEVVEELRQRGFAVATLDWRGQGGSQRLLKNPRKGHVETFSDYQLDLEAFMRDIVLPDCPPPYFGLCHSMGSTILLQAVKERRRRWFERLVLCSPMIDLELPRKGAIRALAAALRGIGLGRLFVPGGSSVAIGTKPFPGNRLSTDMIRYQRNAGVVAAFPELGLGSPSMRWLDEAFRAMAPLADPAYPSLLRQPILCLLAGSDPIVATDAAERFAIRLLAGAGFVIPGARHELLQERDAVREQVWAAFDAFVPGSTD